MRKSQREKRAKYLDGGSEGALSGERRAPEQRQSDLRSLISDLRSAMRGDRASNDDGDVTVRGLLGLVLVCVLGIFFFLFINTSVLCVWFAEFCVWFAFVLGFDLSASQRRRDVMPGASDVMG